MQKTTKIVFVLMLCLPILNIAISFFKRLQWSNFFITAEQPQPPRWPDYGYDEAYIIKAELFWQYEFSMFLLYAIPLFVIYKLVSKDWEAVKTDFILIRPPFLKNVNLGLRRLLSLLISPALLFVLAVFVMIQISFIEDFQYKFT